MNENSYSEYAVVVRQTKEMRAKQIAVIGVTAVSLVMALMVYWVFLVVTLAGAVGCYFAWLCSDMEYETIFRDAGDCGSLSEEPPEEEIPVRHEKCGRIPCGKEGGCRASRQDHQGLFLSCGGEHLLCNEGEHREREPCDLF